LSSQQNGADSKITLIENEYACLWYHPDTRIVHHKFLQPIADEPFRNVLLTGLRQLREHGAQKWLSDDRNNSILSAEDSAWSQDYWLPFAIESGWKYWAILLPTDARGKINMQRMAEFVASKHRIGVELFSEPDTAWQWLLQQGNSNSI
jgi:hypothetical protein